MANESVSKAVFKYVRISPTKVRGVINMVRGRRVEDALDLLRGSDRRAAGEVIKLIKSAVANADQKGGIDVDRLFVQTITVDQGPRWKRFRPRSRGMAHPIVKGTSHISVELGEK